MACGGDNDASNEAPGNDLEDEKTELKIGLDPYDYSTVPAYLSQVILEQEGFKVEIEEAEVGILYEALSGQDIDAFIDVWSPNLHKDYIEKYGGSFEIAGTLYSDMPMGIGVPTYLEDINSIEDVANNPELFNHEIYAIEPGSGMALTTEEMVETYGMDDFIIQNSSVAIMLAQVDSMIKNKEAIAFNAWRPHPMFVHFDIKFLEDPLNTWKMDDVQIAVTPSLKEESPTAYKLFSNMELTLEMVETWIMDLDSGKSLRELAEDWVEANPETVDEWLEK
ncbi:glycine betaine ABC transporter substrate-binding protein [Ornithinibacillus halotolerans]|uniref:glycine betaine ABC transporter substrate-binding protein n=1 Tax=Ornithinibacillus halotolerans TaxID=1274357 RepID=UPI0016638781|nr:glycine betaine ABC transporter substrate-binding protein [Ornithinibacillus halotolerans]